MRLFYFTPLEIIFQALCRYKLNPIGDSYYADSGDDIRLPLGNLSLTGFTRFGVKFNPILDNPIFEFIADIFLPSTKTGKKPKSTKKEVMSKYENTYNRHL